MKMKKRRFAGRIAAMAIAVLLLMTVLVGCSSGSKKTLTVGSIVHTDANSLSADELTALANMLAAVYSDSMDVQEWLVAATRGYDMTQTGFDDTQINPSENKGFSADAVKNVITKANTAAKDSGKQIAFDYSGINEADVTALIRAFQTAPSTESSGSFLDVVLTAVGKALSWITNILGFGNYLVGICIFAVLIEILMLPFAIKQQKNSIRQASLRPKEMAIRKKYKGRNDQATLQKMQQEIQEFYQRENFSPYSGCLPLLIQLPIIMALYNIVIDPLRYVMGQASTVSQALSTYFTTARAAGGLGETLSGNGTIAILSYIKTNGIEVLEGIKDFAFFSNGESLFESLNGIAGKIPNFNIGPFNFGLVPSFSRFDILLLVPVLTFVVYFTTSKLNRKFAYQPATNGGAEDRQVACSNTMMDVTMPLMSTFFTFMVPALVGVYWMFRSLVGLLKQFILSRVMPMPKFTEEDYKKAEREMAGKRVVKKSENVGKVRSLHHIDDEDYDDTRDRALARKAAIEEREREEQNEKKKKTPFGAPSMKEENQKRDKKSEESQDEEAPVTEDNNDKNKNNIQE